MYVNPRLIPLHHVISENEEELLPSTELRVATKHCWDDAPLVN